MTVQYDQTTGQPITDANGNPLPGITAAQQAQVSAGASSANGLGNSIGSLALGALAAPALGQALTNPNYSNAVTTGQQAQNQLLSTPIPSLQSLSYNPTQTTVAGTLTPTATTAVQTGPNAYNDIQTNPADLAAANNSLGGLQNIAAQGGLGTANAANLQAIQNAEANQSGGQQKAILQSAQQRGMGNSGTTLLGQLLAQQGAATQGNQQGTALAGQEQQQALQALTSAGQLGAGLQSQQYQQGAQAANAQNAIQQYNASNAQGVNNTNAAAQTAAQAGNVQNAQNVENTNAAANTASKQYNAAQNQTQEQDINQVNNENVNAANNTAASQKALGQAGTNATTNAASALGGALTSAGGVSGVASGAQKLFDGVSSLFS